MREEFLATRHGPFSGAIDFKAGASYLPGLDGLRAISILIVLVAHLGFGNVIPGGLGVTVFFFASGFLITRILVGEQNKADGRIDLKGFYIRRFLRLMPALYVFIPVSMLLMAPFGGKPLLAHVAAAGLYFVNYYDVLDTFFGWPERAVPWGHLWSLAVEEHFYLLFPAALAVWGKTHTGRLRLIVSVMVVCALWRVVVFQGLGWSDDYTYQATDTRLESIAWGCLFAVLLDGAPRENSRLQSFIGWRWVSAGLLTILVTVLFRDPVFRATWRYSVQGAALFVLVLNLYTLPGARWVIALLERAPFRWIGRLSYSLYLWHMPVIWLVARASGDDPNAGARLSLPLMAIATVLSFACASISYYGVERPLFGLRKRFGGKPVESMARSRVS